MRKNTRELIQRLPFEMRDRFGGYLDYASDVLTDIRLEQRIPRRDIDSVRDDFEIIILVRFLHSFFTQGLTNYENSLKHLASKGVVDENSHPCLKLALP